VTSSKFTRQSLLAHRNFLPAKAWQAGVGSGGGGEQGTRILNRMGRNGGILPLGGAKVRISKRFWF